MMKRVLEKSLCGMARPSKPEMRQSPQEHHAPSVLRVAARRSRSQGNVYKPRCVPKRPLSDGGPVVGFEPRRNPYLVMFIWFRGAAPS